MLTDKLAICSAMVTMMILSDPHKTSQAIASIDIHTVPLYRRPQVDHLDLLRISFSSSSSAAMRSDDALRDASSVPASEEIFSNDGLRDSVPYSAAAAGAFADLDDEAPPSSSSADDVGFRVFLATSSHATDSRACADDGSSLSSSSADDVGFQCINPSTQETDSAASCADDIGSLYKEAPSPRVTDSEARADDGLSSSSTSADDGGCLHLAQSSRVSDAVSSRAAKAVASYPRNRFQGSFPAYSRMVASAKAQHPYPQDRFHESPHAYSSIIASSKAQTQAFARRRGMASKTRSLFSRDGESKRKTARITLSTTNGAPTPSPIVTGSFHGSMRNSDRSHRQIATQKHMRGGTIDPGFSVDKRRVPSGPNPLHN